MSKKKYFFFLFYFIATLASSQKEANNWYFGSNSGLNFNSNPPLGITGSLNSPEGNSSISDKNGNLLFYTDGITVWNKNHVPMQNGTGLLGFASSTQSALILRKPGSDNIYYIFTADGTSSALNHHMENGYRYSIVDMSLSGGLGNVTSVKNVLLYAPSTEKLCAVKQADGVNLWLMTHEWNSSNFRAYSITCNGIDTNAVISNVGLPHHFSGGLYADVIGQMKFSSDGKRLALAILGQLRVQLFDFDNSTGILSNPINILAYWPDAYLQPDGTPFDFEYVYGVEFSPDGHLLYLTCIDYGYLFQYDLSAGNSIGISSTGILFQPGPWCTVTSFGWTCPGVSGELQLGPDGKIYMAYKPNLGLNAISNPNVYGLGCNYDRSSALINPSNYGLPSFSASYFDTEAIRVVNQNCGVSLSTNFSNTSYYWSFDDSTSITDFSTEANPSYTYPDTGKYTITLAITNNFGCSDTVKKEIYVTQCESINPGPEPNPVGDPSLSFPNIFSPNGDGINDSFEIIGLDKYPDNEIIIYNRWGNEIFHKKGNLSLTSFTGNGLSDGVYYYIVSIPSIDLKHKGYVTIIR